MNFINKTPKNTIKKNNDRKIYNFKDIKIKKRSKRLPKMFNDFNNNTYVKDTNEVSKKDSLNTINSYNDDNKSCDLNIINDVLSSISMISFMRLHSNLIKIKVNISKNNNFVIAQGKSCNEIINILKGKLINEVIDNFEIEIVILVIIRKLNNINFENSDYFYNQFIDNIINK